MSNHMISRGARALFIAAMLAWANAAQAAITVYTATLTGANEPPPNVSPGTGTATVTIDDILNTLTVNITFSGLTGTAAASHIHATTASPFTGTAGVALPFPGFPAATSGTYVSAFDLLSSTTYTSAFLTANGGTAAGAEAGLIAALNSGKAYVNIHTANFPGGEIRGFLVAVPEPATWAMMLLGLGAIGLAFRRRRPLAASA